MSDFKEIKSRVNIVSEIQRITSIETKKEGKTYAFKNCPFCKHHGCFKIKENEDFYKCFSCDIKGDIFTFYEKYYQIGKYEALTRLAEQINYPLKQTNQSTPAKNIFNDIVEYYHKKLLNNNSALKYQTHTRFHSIKTLELMKVGYTTGRLRAFLTSKGYSDKEQIETGMITNKNGQIN